jgi:hypothetical protein
MSRSGAISGCRDAVVSPVLRVVDDEDARKGRGGHSAAFETAAAHLAQFDVADAARRALGAARGT